MVSRRFSDSPLPDLPLWSRRKIRIDCQTEPKHGRQKARTWKACSCPGWFCAWGDRCRLPAERCVGEVVSLCLDFRRRTWRHHTHLGIPLLFKLSDMAAIGPLTMARVNFVVRMNQTLLAANFRDIEKLWAFQVTCIREISLISGGHVWEHRTKNSGHHTQYSGREHFTVCTYERGARGFGWSLINWLVNPLLIDDWFIHNQYSFADVVDWWPAITHGIVDPIFQEQTIYQISLIIY